MSEMRDFILAFGQEMVNLNQNVSGFQSKSRLYSPGIGPYHEDSIVDLVMGNLQSQYPENDIRPNKLRRAELGLNQYLSPSGKPATPDLVLNQRVILEFKLARPINDNGEREDSWFKKAFEPFSESYSAFIDVEKLVKFKDSDLNEYFKKWIVILGFERIDESSYQLDSVFPSLFTFISQEVKKCNIKQCIREQFTLGARHPYHQILKIYAFEY